MRSLKLSYEYTKERKEFGRHCRFTDKNERLTDVPSKKSAKIRSEYIRRDPVHFATQLSFNQSGVEVNTENATYEPRGFFHTEGGWPKEVNNLDEEQVARYKRRIEREPQYEKQLKKLCAETLSVVNQNNAVNVYQKYFAEQRNEMEETKFFNMDTIRRFVDPIESPRCANHICFSPNRLNIVVAYSTPLYPFKPRDRDECTSYIWNIEFPNTPTEALMAETFLTQLEFNAKEESIIAGGLTDGLVCVYDIRAGNEPQNESIAEQSHREPVTSLLWTQSKTNTDIFSCSTDGQVIWWDIRNLSQHTETLQCTTGCTAMNYSPNLPTRFLVGTEDGFMYYGNRRAASSADRLGFKAHCIEAPITCIERNPVADKHILTVGGNSFDMWTEDCKDHPIYSSQRQPTILTCGTSNPKRGSLLFIGDEIGKLAVYDILLDTVNPITVLQPMNSRMIDVRCHPTGNLIACSHASGDVFLIQLSNDLSSITRNERGILGQYFDREVNRKTFVMAKLREIKLLLSQKGASEPTEDGDDDAPVEEFDLEKVLQEIDVEFDEYDQ